MVSHFIKVSRLLLIINVLYLKKKLFFFFIKVSSSFFSLYFIVRLFDSTSFFFLFSCFVFLKKNLYADGTLLPPAFADFQYEVSSDLEEEEPVGYEFFKEFRKKLKRLSRFKSQRRWHLLWKATRILWSRAYKIGAHVKDIRIIRYSFFKNYTFLSFFKQFKHVYLKYSLGSPKFSRQLNFFFFKGGRFFRILFFKKNVRVAASFNKKQKTNRSLPFIRECKITSFKQLFLVFFAFFRLKNFFFFNNFYNFFSLVPLDLALLWREEMGLKDVQEVLTDTILWKPSYPWFFFFVESLQAFEKNAYYLNFFYIFLVNYAESLLKTRVCFVVKNVAFNLSFFETFISWITNRAAFRLKKFNRFFFFNEFLEVLCVSFLKKDIRFFEMWFVRFLEKIHFKLHKGFLFLLNKFFLEFFKFFSAVFLLKGLKIDVRGKLSAAGNSKKRHFLIKFGEISFSKKKNRISSVQSIVPTSTGVLGVELLLVY